MHDDQPTHPPTVLESSPDAAEEHSIDARISERTQLDHLQAIGTLIGNAIAHVGRPGTYTRNVPISLPTDCRCSELEGDASDCPRHGDPERRISDR